MSVAAGRYAFASGYHTALFRKERMEGISQSPSLPPAWPFEFSSRYLGCSASMAMYISRLGDLSPLSRLRVFPVSAKARPRKGDALPDKREPPRSAPQIRRNGLLPNAANRLFPDSFLSIITLLSDAINHG